VVVMAHGLGGQKGLGLTESVTDLPGRGSLYWSLTTAPMAPLMEPRHWFAFPARHIKDWEAAVKYIIGQ
jgi:hypothetical protein